MAGHAFACRVTMAPNAAEMVKSAANNRSGVNFHT
jgi:hypothetical protein